MSKKKTPGPAQNFVHWFRHAAPYINAFRGRTFVITFGGEVLLDAQFASLAHDLALLNSLGVKLVLVHGARPQIEQRLKLRGASMRYANGLRITDDEALVCVKDAVGSVRVEIEALLSMGVVNSPMHGARIRVVSGNFATAQPVGVRNGIDHLHTGKVRKVDAEGIRQQLEKDALVLLSPIAYSPTGEAFNLAAEDVATAAAIALQADKLICLTEGRVVDNRKRLVRELVLDEAESLLAGRHKLGEELAATLRKALLACTHGVRRAHLLDRHIDGGLIQELFTRDGVGTLLTSDSFEGTRQARVEDIGGLLELIEPLEREGVLVRRSREQLELEIDKFTVMERDGAIIACAALLPFISDKMAELACLVVHPDYRGQSRGQTLYTYMERRARQLGVKKIFVLTTQTAHWFRERGFRAIDIKSLPMKRRELYNYNRNSKVYCKLLD
ncbi:MAG TPA: amino-acid N-acetyltransferase [Gammaproteobacteria bacterium]|nr:amino-acid N-acetyltransferase [Gammaproteobacteria bacterium]